MLSTSWFYYLDEGTNIVQWAELPNRQLIDAIASRFVNNKYLDEAQLLFEDMASNESRWAFRGRTPKVDGVLEVDSIIALVAKVDILAKMIDLLTSGSSSQL